MRSGLEAQGRGRGVGADAIVVVIVASWPPRRRPSSTVHLPSPPSMSGPARRPFDIGQDGYLDTPSGDDDERDRTVGRVPAPPSVGGDVAGRGLQVPRRPRRLSRRADHLLRVPLAVPLLLLFASVLGFALQNNPDLRQQLLDSTLSQFPVIGDQLGEPRASRAAASPSSSAPSWRCTAHSASPTPAKRNERRLGGAAVPPRQPDHGATEEPRC